MTLRTVHAGRMMNGNQQVILAMKPLRGDEETRKKYENGRKPDADHPRPQAKDCHKTAIHARTRSKHYGAEVGDSKIALRCFSKNSVTPVRLR